MVFSSADFSVSWPKPSSMLLALVRFSSAISRMDPAADSRALVTSSGVETSAISWWKSCAIWATRADRALL